MQSYQVRLNETTGSIERQVLDAFLSDEHVFCHGEKFGATHEFELSIYEVTGRKIGQAAHILNFAGVECNTDNYFRATANNPASTDAAFHFQLDTAKKVS